MILMWYVTTGNEFRPNKVTMETGNRRAKRPLYLSQTTHNLYRVIWIKASWYSPYDIYLKSWGKSFWRQDPDPGVMSNIYLGGLHLKRRESTLKTKFLVFLSFFMSSAPNKTEWQVYYDTRSEGELIKWPFYLRTLRYRYTKTEIYRIQIFFFQKRKHESI